jgi:selenocysteine lyase/cysteine desulfurase
VEAREGYESWLTVDVVPQPDDGNWTAAVLDAIERPGAPHIALASISSIHWSDGGAVDMARVAPALRRHGAALLVDATHAVGVVEHDVRSLDPDYLVFPTYKWLLGPYGRAFLYIAKRHQNGVPLEQTSYGRRAIASERPIYFNDTSFVSGGRRFDMGERDHFISLEMASIGMEMLAQWGREAVEARLRMLTGRLAHALRLRRDGSRRGNASAAHLSLGFPRGMPQQLIERLAAENVHRAAGRTHAHQPARLQRRGGRRPVCRDVPPAGGRLPRLSARQAPLMAPRAAPTARRASARR